MRQRLRRARVAALLLLVAVFLAVAAFSWVASSDPRSWVAFVIAAGPLVCPGLPAALFLYATLRRGDPYDVSHRYPPGAYLGRGAPSDE